MLLGLMLEVQTQHSVFCNTVSANWRLERVLSWSSLEHGGGAERHGTVWEVINMLCMV